MDKKIEELKKKIEQLENEIQRSKQGEVKEKKIEKKEKFVPMKILYAWKAPSRVFIPRDRVWFLTVGAIALVFILFFAFLLDYVVILVICVIVLIAFLLASVPPEKVEHQITTRGVKSFDTMYKWKDLKSFWIAQKHGLKLLYIDTKLRFPGRLLMLMKSRDEIKIIKHLRKFIDFKEFEEKQGWLSRVSDGEIIDPEKYLKSFKRQRKKSSPKK